MANRLMHVVCLVLFLGSMALAAPSAKALEDSCVPIRPGAPGGQHFWNRYAKQFIYAPAFDIDAWRTAAVEKYKFTVHSDTNGKDYVFEAPQPFNPLSPIWKDLPVGRASLSVEALDADAKSLGVVGTREFSRMPVFAGPYGKPDKTYKESVKWALQFQFNQPHYQGWKENKRVEHNLNCYPNKIMSAVFFGMPRYAKLADKPSDRKDAITIAENCAQSLISISFPKGSAMEYWPPTYDRESDGAKNRLKWISQTDRGYNVMTVFPADAGLAYLDLYDATGKQEFLGAAKRIADTYRKLQLPNGTWPHLISEKTGKANGDDLAIPNQPIVFLDRLEQQYGITDYKETCKRAVDWMFENPMKNYMWQGQFEDIKPSAGYLNLSHKPAVLFTIYLFDHAKEKPEYVSLAENLLKFSEDQFVVWEPCGPNEDRVTPSALEQYRCYGPIGSTMARFIKAWVAAYNTTGKVEYLEKAQSLANSIVAYQARCGGRYRTWLFRNLNNKKQNNNWDNAATEEAMAILELSAALGEK